MLIGIHHTANTFSERWLAYCRDKNIPVKIVNCYDSDINVQLKDCDALMWHYNHKGSKDSKFARQLLFALQHSGKKVFPDFNSAWHFDDKIAETYLLQSIGAPIPDSWVYYTISDFLESFKADLTFPVVTKLRTGAGSHNVKLIKTKKEAIQYA